MEKSIEEKLSDLREEYKKTNDPIKKRVLEARGRALKNSIEMKKKREA